MDKAIDKKLVNPWNIDTTKGPIIVLSDHTSGFIQWAIKWRTRATYNHIMWLHKPGLFASQGNVFSEVPLTRYMTPRSRLKFWRINGMSDVQIGLLNKAIKRDLDLPWWQRQYDYLGILGQALGLSWINNPFKAYCSEKVSAHLGAIFAWAPRHPSPQQLNELFKNRHEMEVLGYWFGD